jgi:hypothetical protein
MKHEMHDATLVDRAKLILIDSQKVDVMREEMTGGRQKDRKPPGEHQANGRKRQQRPAVSDQRRQQARTRVIRVLGHRR